MSLRVSEMVVNIAIFGIFLIIVAAIGFFLWQTLFAPEKQSGAPHAQHGYADQHRTDKNLVGTAAMPSLSNSANEGAIVEYTRWLAFFTAALVLATIALFISGERNVQISRRFAQAAQTSAEAALKGIEINRAQIRGYLTIPDTPEFKIMIDPSGKTVVRINIINAGQSAARRVRIDLWVGIQPSGTAAIIPIEQPQISFLNDIGHTAPAIEREFKFNIPEPLWTSLKQAGGAILVKGTMSFDDIFGDRQSDEIDLWIIRGANQIGSNDFIKLIRPPDFGRGVPRQSGGQ